MMRIWFALGILLSLIAVPVALAQPPAGSDAQKGWVRQFLQEVYNHGNLALLTDRLAPTFRWHAPSLTGESGAEGFKQAVSRLHSVFPDLVVTVEGQTAEGGEVVTRWTLRGTHKGEWHGIPATGRRVQMMGITIFRLDGERIAEGWEIADEIGLLQQIAPERRTHRRTEETAREQGRDRRAPNIDVNIGYWVTRWRTGAKGRRR